MTVERWRQKHRKCKFCKHLKYMSLPMFCIGRGTWCKAKEKIVNDKMPRFLCAVFQLREIENTIAETVKEVTP